MVMANITYGDNDDFLRSMESPILQQTKDYMQVSVNNFAQAVKGVKSVLTDVRDIFKEEYSVVKLAAIDKLRSKLESTWENDTIRRLEDIPTVLNAGPVMQKYIMANQLVRELYQQDRLEGYDGTYIDENPGKIGDNDPVYQRVMTGLLYETEEKKWAYKNYMHFDGSKLSINDKVIITNVWNMVEDHINNGDGTDPTSNDRGLIG